MRTYANFLLLEDVLTNLPAGSTFIQNAANTLMNPNVEIVELNCGTLLGSVQPLNYSLEGQTELANDTVITIDRITTLLSQRVSSIRIRNISTCISKGGICDACYNTFRAVLVPRVLEGTWLLDGSWDLDGTISPPPTSRLTLSSEFIYKTDIIIGDGINSSYHVTQNSSQYTKTNLTENVYLDVVGLTDTTITFTTVRHPTDIFALHYYDINSDPFLEYIAKTYSGGLLGISPLPSYPTLLKPSLYQTMFSTSQMSLLRNELNTYANNIPPTYLEYCDTIVDTLEKVLFIIYLYAIYANVQ